MKLKTSAFVEHQTSGNQDVLSQAAASGLMLAPGGCTTCLGCTCTSCSCCGAAVPTKS